MDELKQWFEELSDKEHKLYSLEDCDFYIYKGFKLTYFKNKDSYLIQDVRVSSFYTPPKQEDLEIIRGLGIVDGADKISYLRNKHRVDVYTRRLERFFKDEIKYKSLLSTDTVFYKKKLRNCKENIGKYIDLMFFYKSKISHYESKQQLNIKQNE